MKLRLGVMVAALGLGRAVAAPPPPAQEVFVAPGPGLQMLAVWIDPDGTARTRTCTGVPCTKDSFGAVTLATKVSNATLTVVTIGEGKRVVHVKATGADGAPWEAVVVGRAEAQVIFSGKTGFTQGEEGERTGQMVRIFDDGANKVVMVADIRQDLRICDQPMTPLSPKVLDPKTLELRAATVPRLSKEQRAAASPVIATSHAGNVDAPIGKLFVAAGASSALGTPQSLVDGDPATTWGEARTGDGHGEFVMLRSPAEVPIAKLTVVTTPPAVKGQTQPATLAAPKKMFLITNDKAYAVTMPEDGAMHPGQAYDVPLAEPIKSSCVAVVLEEAYGAQTKPDVTLAELYAYSELEQGGATPEAIAKELKGSGPRTEAAAGVLKRSGDPGAKAVLATYASLDPTGRARAIEVASSMACDVGAQVLIGALDDKEAEIARRARTKLERCGKVAAPALIAALAGSDLSTRGRVAPILAATAPSLAVDPLAKAMGDGPPDVRSSIRGAFARAVRTAPKEKLAALLGDGSRSPQARLDLLRASTERLGDVQAEAKMALEALLGANADFPTRYLAMEPLAALAKNDAALLTRLTDAVSKDESWPVRARAAEVSVGVPGAHGALLAATNDPEPRVREAAVRAAGDAKVVGILVPATKLLGTDIWTFVRVAAASTLGALPAAPDVDAALADAVKNDAAFQARGAAIIALGMHKARSQSKRVIESLENKEEHPDVRIAAAHALGDMCETNALDALTSAARKSVSPIASLEDLTIATSAMRSLGAIHPKDLASRLEPLLAPDARAEMKRAAQATIAEKATCP